MIPPWSRPYRADRRAGTDIKSYHLLSKMIKGRAGAQPLIEVIGLYLVLDISLFFKRCIYVSICFGIDAIRLRAKAAGELPPT